MEIVRFDQDDIANKLAGLTDEQLDQLAFGAVKLDENGVIQIYNEAEAVITGRNANDVIGKNFFKDIAPCTDTDEFAGRFREGVSQGALNTAFEYTFDYKMTPTKVRVQMKSAAAGGGYWVFVKRM